MTLFQTFEPHTEYMRAVQLRPNNFDELADEISKWPHGEGGSYLVGKIIRYGNNYALTLTPESDPGAEPLKCHLFNMIISQRGEDGRWGLQVMDRGEFRQKWRLMASDPYA